MGANARLGVYQDFMDFDDNYSVLHHQETSTSSRSLLSRPRSPQKLRTTWAFVDAWPDDTNYALDEDSGERYDKELEGDGWLDEGEKTTGKKRKRAKNPRSLTSVSFNFKLVFCITLTYFSGACIKSGQTFIGARIWMRLFDTMGEVISAAMSSAQTA